MGARDLRTLWSRLVPHTCPENHVLKVFRFRSWKARVTSYCKLCNYVEPKLFSWAEPAICSTFSSSNFTVLDHILSTAGDALRTNNMHANCKPSNCQHINPPSVKHPQHYHQKWENMLAFESTWMQQCSWQAMQLKICQTVSNENEKKGSLTLS